MQLDAVQGRSEARRESYIRYDERALELLTPQCAKSASRIGGFADEQAGAVHESEEMYMSHNHEINVLSYYFSRGNDIRCFPRQIEVEGRELSFMETGLRCLVQRGQEFIQIFNMSDGHRLYRLSFEPGSRTWKLLSSRAL